MDNRKTEFDFRIYWWEIVLVLLLAWMLFGCGQPAQYVQPVVIPAPQVQAQQNYQIIQDPNTGVQYSVFYDNGVQQMMELAIFTSMMNQGGYGYVIHHYHDNPSYYRRYDSRVYSRYRSVPRSSYPAFRSTVTPSRASNTPAFRSTTSSPVRSTPTFRSSSSTPTFRSSSSSSSTRSTPSFRSSRH